MKTARLAAAVAFALAGLAHAQDTSPPPAPTPDTPPSPAVATPSATKAPALPAVENSVVKIFATVRRPDPYKPWT